MIRLRKILLLVVPLAVVAASLAGSGRAQPSLTGRFAFADTTLLRDTLGLVFGDLFHVADSLAVRPDSLRAWSIRLRVPVMRIVALADSLGMPADSVAPVLIRERFNPLAARGTRTVNTLVYNTTYSIQKTSTAWSNGADYNLVTGPWFVRNNTSIQIDTYKSGGQESFRENRTSVSEAGWKYSNNLSLGARAALDGFDNTTPGSLSNDSERKTEVQLSMRSRQQPARGLTSELNAFGGVLDLDNLGQVKQGFSGDVNGRVRYAYGSWFTNDASGQLTGNFASTRAKGDPGSPVRPTLDGQDFSQNLRGTLGLWSGAPVGMNVNYQIRNIRVENPVRVDRPDTTDPTGERKIPADTLQQVLTNNRNLDLALRARLSNERYLNLTQRFGINKSASGGNASVQNTREDDGLTVNGRWALGRFTLDGNFGVSEAISRYPRRTAQGGYKEDLISRTIDGTLTWIATRKLTAKATGSVSLSRYRYAVIDTFNSPPVPRDNYRQTYRVDCVYTHSTRVNTNLSLDVSRTLLVNIPAASTASNNELRSYRAGWTWSYRLMTGLTATQRNQLTADYQFFPRLATTNRLSLDYSTITTLNAVVTPRLTLDVTHNARIEPSGNWVRLDDGLDYLREADESESYTLTARANWTPIQGIAVNVSPEYTANDRRTTADGVIVPQRAGRALNVSGGLSLNLPVGGHGVLTGDVRRTFRSDGSTTYSAGVPQPRALSESDFWNGALQFSWTL
jgi:hypothetical protein